MSTGICTWRRSDDVDRDVEWSIKLFGLKLRGTGRKPPIKLSSCKNFLVYVTWDYQIRVWNIDKKSEYARFAFHSGWVSDVSLSVIKNTLVAGSFDKNVTIWDFQEMKLRHSFECKSYVCCVDVLESNGKIVAGCTDGNFYVYSDNDTLEIKSKVHMSYPICFGKMRDDRIMSIGNDNFVVVWELHSEGKERMLINSSEIVNACFLKSLYIVSFYDLHFRVYRYLT